MTHQGYFSGREPMVIIEPSGPRDTTKFRKPYRPTKSIFPAPEADHQIGDQREETTIDYH